MSRYTLSLNGGESDAGWLLSPSPDPLDAPTGNVAPARATSCYIDPIVETADACIELLSLIDMPDYWRAGTPMPAYYSEEAQRD